MNKQGKIETIAGYIIPWISIVLIVATVTYFCDNIIIRSLCILDVVIHGIITLRLAKKCYKNDKDKSEFGKGV